MIDSSCSEIEDKIWSKINGKRFPSQVCEVLRTKICGERLVVGEYQTRQSGVSLFCNKAINFQLVCGAVFVLPSKVGGSVQ